MVEVDKNKLGHNKNYYTKRMFYELNGYNENEALYTLSDEDVIKNGITLPSIRRLYVEMEDIHEYEFATTYFAGWSHWQKLLKSPMIKPHIDEWRDELEVKIRTRNLKRMEELAAEGDRQAIKYMADKGWTGATSNPRGRPSKEEVKGELKKSAEEKQRLAEDYSRIMQ